MIQLFEQALRLQGILEAKRWRFCFIGGIAVQHWGEPRVTRDVDLALFTGFATETQFIDALLMEYRARIDDARDFAVRHRVLLLSTEEGVPIDVGLAALPFESLMVDRATKVEFEPGVALRICSAEDLFVLKAFADREQDRADLIGIARRRGDVLDWDSIEDRLAPIAAAKDDQTIMQRVRTLRRQFVV